MKRNNLTLEQIIELRNLLARLDRGTANAEQQQAAGRILRPLLGLDD